MATKYVTATCSECGFPISGRSGQSINCPHCGVSGKISGVNIPDPLFWGVGGLVLGIIIGRSIHISKQVGRLLKPLQG